MVTRARNRVIIHSNAPTAATGYGVQTRYLATMLAADGYEVAVSATWGHQGRISKWETSLGDEVTLYPMGWETNSPDVLIGHAEHWFDGDPDAGIIILLCDVWSLLRPFLCETLRQFEVISWTPVDHHPVPPLVRKFCEQSGARVAAMSRHGQTQFTTTGLDAAYVPLGVDTEAYVPTFVHPTDNGPTDSRTLFDIPLDAFVVGMVAMNKDPHDRKGFGEALAAFGRFHRDHPESVLYIHTEPHGVLGGGYELPKMAAHCGVPAHALIFPNGYAYRLGLPPSMMAATYTAFDVLLAPSRGEGFCVPLVEAQACGTPVIASDFTAQPELVSEEGWLVAGQMQWNPTQSAFYKTANVDAIVEALEAAHAALQDRPLEIADKVREFAADYDYRRIYTEHWQPLLAEYEAPPPVEKPVMEGVDVIVPLMRPENLDRIIDSLDESRARLVVVHDTTAACPLRTGIVWVSTGRKHTSYAEKVNLGVEKSNADWVLVVGDDVEFTPGWFDTAAALSAHYDIVGTNDSEEGRVRNPNVAAGRHADHFFIRRSYIDDEGASLDGPGVAMPSAYRHWYVDREVIQLARARGVYGHAADCRIIHHHPGYDGDEEARAADETYMAAVEAQADDEATWLQRAPLIEQHRR